MTLNIDASDDDDMFLKGGPIRPVSIYLNNGNAISDDDDDDDDDDVVISVSVSKPGTKKRGRPSKRDKDILREMEERRRRAAKKAKRSVFDEDSDDEVQLISETPKSKGSRRDSMDDEAARRIAEARELLALENENLINEQAEREAQREIERTERLREEEKTRQKRQEQQQQKARADSAADMKPIQLTVRHGETKRVKMRIRRRDSVLKMLGPFCKKFGLDKSMVRMEFEGEELSEQDTPRSLELEGNEIIDVMLRR